MYLNRLDNSTMFLQQLKLSMNEYFENGSRSNLRLERLTLYIVTILQNIFDDDIKYQIKTEYNIPSFNSSLKKRCDIVVLYDDIPVYIFPIKFPMSNYKQNKNNYWENLCGECIQIKMINLHVKIIPINIIFNHVPYITSNNIIKKFESISYENTFQIYNDFLVADRNNIFYDFKNYIVDVKHKNIPDDN